MEAHAASHPFPSLRWAAVVWLCLWIPTYAAFYGFGNFLHLCDVAVLLTCVGLWRGSALLLSMSALTSIVIDLAWDLDLAVRLGTGRHLLGGTEYMWEAKYPLWVRFLSLFHLVLPVLLLWALRCVGYDRRALRLQSLLALATVALARFVGPDANVNFAWRDPFFHRSWGPAPLHVLVIFAGLMAVVYLPTHALLSRLFPGRTDS
jgi:hypothetical protein